MRFSSVLALVALLSTPALAQSKVVVLELDGDPQGKLRTQIEGALKTAGVVELVRRERFTEALAVIDALPAAATEDPDVLLLHAVLLQPASFATLLGHYIVDINARYRVYLISRRDTSPMIQLLASLAWPLARAASSK